MTKLFRNVSDWFGKGHQEVWIVKIMNQMDINIKGKVWDKVGEWKLNKNEKKNVENSQELLSSFNLFLWDYLVGNESWRILWESTADDIKYL